MAINIVSCLLCSLITCLAQLSSASQLQMWQHVFLPFCFYVNKIESDRDVPISYCRLLISLQLHRGCAQTCQARGSTVLCEL